MPRITISIPNDLKRRLADARVKRALNVSRVCQEALRREVRRLLDLPLDLERMEGLLDRLRAEHRQRKDRWFEMGSRVAREWIEDQAGLDELARLGEASMQRRMDLLRHRPPAALAAAIADNEAEDAFQLESLLRGFAATLGLMWEAIEKNL